MNWLVEIHLARPVPELGAELDGALVRLVGETKVKKYFPWELLHRGAKTSSSIPLRGEMWPARVEDIDLPPEFSQPVDIRRMSRRVRVVVERYLEFMISDRVEEDRRREPITPYDDPELLKPENALLLAARMWKSGMLTETDVVEVMSVTLTNEIFFDIRHVGKRYSAGADGRRTTTERGAGGRWRAGGCVGTP